jgi:hypothetical protein
MSLAHFLRIIFGAAILCGNLEIVPQRRFNPEPGGPFTTSWLSF